MDNYLEQFEQDIQEKPINWREIFDKLMHHWRWFVVSGIIALVAGFLYGRMQNDIYELKSSILIIDQTRSGQMNEMSVLKQLDAAGLGGGRSTSMINNEEQVLHSTTLMKRVVNRLELYTTYSHRVFMRNEELYTESPLYARMDSAALNSLTGALVLQVTPKNGKLSINGKYNEITFSHTIAQLPASLSTPAGKVQIQLRPGMEFPEDPMEIAFRNPVKVAKSFSQGVLQTEVGKMIDVIDLTIQTTNVRKGQDILNTLTDIYNQDATEQNNQSAVNTARFIDIRLGLLTSELSDVESQMENYKQTNKLTDIDADAQLYVSKSGLFEQQQIESEIQQHLIKYIDEFIHNPANQYAIIPNLGLTDAGLVAIIVKYNELLMTRERISNGSSSENPVLATLTQEITATRKAIQSGIANSRKGLQISNSDLSSQHMMMQSKIRDIPRQEREYLEIKRQQQVKESLYLFLLQKREEASLNMAVAVPKGRVLNTPDDATPVGPHRTMILAIFLMAGLLLPALVIYLADLFKTTVQTRADVEKLTDIPVITELEKEKSGSMMINYQSNGTSNSELFRLLRTKLQFTLDHPQEKVILVTSTMAGEGKTFVSINLSIMLSLADKKVLLMGMDLRNPQLARNFRFETKNGITAYLSGQQPDIHKLIQQAPEFPRLHVLPAGVIPPNPTELIMKEKFAALIQDMKKEFDYIVIDSAPVGAVSDSYLIDRVSDITLYICRAGYTDKRYIEFVNRIREEKTLKRIFLVINDVNFESNRYAYYGKYGYGKKYGYGHKAVKEVAINN